MDEQSNERSARFRTTTWRALATVAVLVAGVCLAPASATASREMTHLMTMDHHMVESDFIGVVRVEGITLPRSPGESRRLEELPRIGYSLVVEDVWSSRWSAAAGTRLTISLPPADKVFEMDARYLVLLRGGTQHATPLTHGQNSVFHIQDERTIGCTGGTTLYAAQVPGFLCSVPSLVRGVPADLTGLRAQVLTRLDRARKRLPKLAAALDADVRRLATSKPGVTP